MKRQRARGVRKEFQARNQVVGKHPGPMVAMTALIMDLLSSSTIASNGNGEVKKQKSTSSLADVIYGYSRLCPTPLCQEERSGKPRSCHGMNEDECDHFSHCR
jgi:hypothetical protein